MRRAESHQDSSSHNYAKPGAMSHLDSPQPQTITGTGKPQSIVTRQHTSSSSTSPVVRIRYEDLVKGADLSAEIEQAFGQDGLGIASVYGVPGFVEARSKLLHLAATFASLPEDVKAKYEHALSHYNFGWSHGKEALSPGHMDTYKGSYYANPVLDIPTKDQALIERYPTYLSPNMWPDEDLPQLREAFMTLGKLIVDAGMLLIKGCDRYVSQSNSSIPQDKLQNVLANSKIFKARLLHYFPAQQTSTSDSSRSQQPQQQEQTGCETSAAAAKLQQQSQQPVCASDQQQRDQECSRQGEVQEQGTDHETAWCGWHTDHGSLTGLTPAMYIKDGKEVPNPDPRSGLYIRNRHGQVVKALIPSDHVAYQVGEAMQIHSGGLLRATPHYVRSANGPQCSGVSRDTFAVFMQPDIFEAMDIPQGSEPSEVAVGQWRQGMDFVQFSEATFQKYYDQNTAKQ